LVAQGRFTDARLANEQHQPAFAPCHGLERSLELPQLTLAADEGLHLRQALR
jgi:hypothetical protein